MALRRSWLLRAESPFLLATSIVSPVLLSIIFPKSSVLITYGEIPATEQSFSRYLDPSDIGFNGDDTVDNLHIFSALGFMSNVRAPAAQVCSSPSCFINTTASAIMATCTSDTFQNPTNVSDEDANSKFRSTSNSDPYVTVSSWFPYTFANFTAAYPSNCTYTNPCNGNWWNIFGA